MDTYKKKTEIKNSVLTISYSLDLTKEIVNLEVADTLVFLQQDEEKMQELFPKYLVDDELSEENLLKLANEYREFLANKK